MKKVIHTNIKQTIVEFITPSLLSYLRAQPYDSSISTCVIARDAAGNILNDIVSISIVFTEKIPKHLSRGRQAA